MFSKQNVDVLNIVLVSATCMLSNYSLMFMDISWCIDKSYTGIDIPDVWINWQLSVTDMLLVNSRPVTEKP